MAERRRQRRRAVVLGVPAAIVAALALVALWRVGDPGGEPGAAGTIGIDANRRAVLEGVEVRQLTSSRTFWAGERNQAPVFVVADSPVRIEPGMRVTITGRIERAPDIDIARRAWGVDEATARAVHERGVYLRASDVTSASPR